MLKRILSALMCICICAVSLISCSHIHRYNEKNTADEYLKKRAFSCSEPSEYYYSCKCGAIGSKSFTATKKHDFSAEKPLSKYLCTDATVDERATYYKSCVNCGEKGSETFAYGDKLPLFNSRSILVFGDSYSAFGGSIPSGYAQYYPAVGVTEVGDMWWSIFAKKTVSKVVRNDAWSGSTICYTGYNGVDCSETSSFIYRYRKLKSEGFFDSNKIDTVFILGGTNDSWANAPLGEMKYEGWTEEDLYNVLPAICHFAHTLKTDLPDARIVFIINDLIKPEIKDAMENAAKHYGIDFLRLHSIAMESSHPNKSGMKSISNQLFELLNK